MDADRMQHHCCICRRVEEEDQGAVPLCVQGRRHQNAGSTATTSRLSQKSPHLRPPAAEGHGQIARSSGFNKAWDKHGNFDLKLGEKIHHEVPSSAAYLQRHGPGRGVPVFTALSSRRVPPLTNSKPWSTPKPGSRCDMFAKIVVRLQIAVTQPDVLCLHSQPARKLFYFKEGEIGFSGQNKHRAKFQDIKSNDLVPFNIFIEAFNHPASARFVRAFWQWAREAKALRKLLGA